MRRRGEAAHVELGTRARKKLKPRSKPKPKHSRKTRLNLRDKADAVFSVWIRERDGWMCVLCGATEQIQCSHLIRRGKQSVRFDEKNCHANCAGCNKRHNYFPEHYTQWFISQYGVDEYNALIERSKVLKKWSDAELTDIAERYNG